MFANSHLIPSCDGGKANTVFVILLARNKISNMARRAFKEKIPQQFGDDCNFLSVYSYCTFNVVERPRNKFLFFKNYLFIRLFFNHLYHYSSYKLLFPFQVLFFFPHSLEVNNINKQTNTACYLREM